jgi:hypothetical protein
VTYDAEDVEAPRSIYIPGWVLIQENLKDLIAAGEGASPDLLYARELPDTPS